MHVVNLIQVTRLDAVVVVLLVSFSSFVMRVQSG